MDSDTKSLWNFSEAYLAFEIKANGLQQTVVLNNRQSHTLDIVMLRQALGISFNI